MPSNLASEHWQDSRDRMDGMRRQNQHKNGNICSRFQTDSWMWITQHFVPWPWPTKAECVCVCGGQGGGGRGGDTSGAELDILGGEHPQCYFGRSGVNILLPVHRMLLRWKGTNKYCKSNLKVCIMYYTFDSFRLSLKLEKANSSPWKSKADTTKQLCTSRLKSYKFLILLKSTCDPWSPWQQSGIQPSDYLQWISDKTKWKWIDVILMQKCGDGGQVHSLHIWIKQTEQTKRLTAVNDIVSTKIISQFTICLLM